MTNTKTIIRHGHLFCGIGMGAAGFNKARPKVGALLGHMKCIGGIDVDPGAIRNFDRIAGVKGTVLDLFDRDQYTDFHGEEPPAEWREATAADIHAAFNHERPNILFLSAPCKGFSGLLSETRSRTDKYQALNRLTLRGIWLALEAYASDPVELIVFENVPRIATRGRHLLDQIVDLLRAYGYATAETTHDCGELGGLAQSRKRFLLVARHVEKVPAFLYQPERRPLRAVGDVLGRMLLPGDERAGPMHRIPNLQWQTWVRLAFVEAGGDWRSLNKLAVADGKLRDYLLVPDGSGWHPNILGVNAWDRPTGTVTSESRPTTGRFAVADPRMESTREGSGFMGVRLWGHPCGTVQGESRPSNGAFSIADPRFDQSKQWNNGQAYGVRRWDDPTGVVAGQQAPGQGAYAVADPRCSGVKHNNCFRVVRFEQASGTVTGGGHPSAGGQSVADPRGPDGKLFGKYHCADWTAPARTVIGGDNNGAYAVADPRVLNRQKGDAYLSGGHYGVVPWTEPSGAVSAAACHDNGAWSVADPRMPGQRDKLVARIRALDGTWHRPFTTLELAALQTLIDPEEQIVLDGLSDSAWREWIGNGVPRDAACAVGEEMGRTLLLAWSGETFMLNATPIWVRNISVALTVAQGEVR